MAVNLKSLWINSFGLAFGDTAGFLMEEFNLQYFTFLIAIILNVILMLNMIISILGDSFDKFQIMKVFHNYKQMTELF
jgi:uncharacterized protein (DUF2062 family)